MNNNFKLSDIKGMTAYVNDEETRLLTKLLEYYKKNNLTDKFDQIEKWLDEKVMFKTTPLDNK